MDFLWAKINFFAPQPIHSPYVRHHCHIRTFLTHSAFILHLHHLPSFSSPSLSSILFIPFFFISSTLNQFHLLRLNFFILLLVLIRPSGFVFVVACFYHRLRDSTRWQWQNQPLDPNMRARRSSDWNKTGWGKRYLPSQWSQLIAQYWKSILPSPACSGWLLRRMLTLSRMGSLSLWTSMGIYLLPDALADFS